MKDKFTDITDSIRKFIENQNLFTDLEKKSVEELINTISVYHEELIFQNKELENRNFEIEKYARENFDLFQNAPIAYVLFDDNLKIIKSNTFFQNFVHKSQDELEKLHLTDFICETSQDQFYLYFKQIIKGQIKDPIVLDFRIDNEIRKVQLQFSLSPLKDKNEYRATLTDLTQVYNLQKLLDESRIYYQKIIQHSPNAILGYFLNENDELILNLFNNAANEILFVDFHSHIGKKIQDIFPNLKDSFIIEKYKEIAKQGGVLKIDNFRYEDENINGFFNLVAYQAEQNHIIIIFRDTTEEYLHSKQLEIENKISISIVNSVSIPELLEIFKQELNHIIDVSNCCLLIYDSEKSDYTSLYQCNQFIDKNECKIDKLLADIVKQNLKTTHYVKYEIENIFAKETNYYSAIIPESWLGVPLIENKNFIGLIIIEEYTKIPKYNNQIINFLQTIANYISSFIQRKKIDQFVNILHRSVVYSPVIIVITDPLGYIQFVNPKFEEVTGYKLEEVKNKKPSILKSGHHDQEFYKNLWDTILSGNVWEGKFLNRKKDGSLYWEEAKIAPVIDENNQISNFVAIKEDITQKEKLFEELKIDKAKAEESDRLKPTFLANMSHEVRTPLNAIMGFSSLLAEEDVSYDERKLFSQIINEKGNELLRLIEDILDISKLDANQMTIANTIVSIPNLFDELKKTYQTFLQKHPSKNIELIFNKPEPDDLNLITDAIRLRQILDNLISNAIKFTEQGYIQVDCKLVEDKVLFSVTDTGIGIAKENFDIIFERFRQAEEDFARRRFGGIGLGLPIVKRLVELLGGKIWLESELGKGSKFYFTIRYNPADQ